MRYRVTLLGQMPPSPPDSEVQLRSFRVSRIIDAASTTDAGMAAIRLLFAEPKFTRMAGAYGEAPDVEVEEVELDPDGDVQAVNRSGYLFYEDD